MDLSLGAPKLLAFTTVSVGAGNTDLSVRPDQGKLFVVKWGYATQDDGAVVQSWLWKDPDLGAAQSIGQMTAAAAWDPFNLFGYHASLKSVHFLLPMVLTYNRYLIFRFAASAIAKNSYAYIMGEEFSGLESYF